MECRCEEHHAPQEAKPQTKFKPESGARLIDFRRKLGCYQLVDRQINKNSSILSVDETRTYGHETSDQSRWIRTQPIGKVQKREHFPKQTASQWGLDVPSLKEELQKVDDK